MHMLKKGNVRLQEHSKDNSGKICNDHLELVISSISGA